MTETPPPTDPSDEPAAPSWNRRPSSVDWSDWDEPGAESPTAYPPPAQPSGHPAAADPSTGQNYPPPQGYSGPQNYPPPQTYPTQQTYPAPAQQGYQPGYPPAQGYQPGYPAPAQQGYQPGYPPAQAQGYQPGYPPVAGQGYPPAAGGGQYPGGYGDPYAQPATRRFDGLSITAFVLGIIAFVPFALGFGIAGLIRTKGRKRRGRWMAVTGMILAVAWIGGAIALVALVGSRDVSRSADGTVTKAGNVSPNNVRVGDCLKLPGRTGTVRTLPVVPCDQPHNAQAFANVTVPGSSYPGGSALLQTSLARCQPLAAAFLSTAAGHAPLTLASLNPTNTSWDLGNHTSHCLLVDSMKNFTGDIREDK